MKWLVSSACVFSALLFTAYAAPASTGLQVSASGSGGGLLGGGGLGNILQNIDLPGLLQGVNSFVKLIGAFCPPLSQVLDNVIQNVTSTAFRVFGRAILRSGGLGGGSGASGGDSGQRVNVVLPTFPPDEDYEDEEDESVTGASTSAVFAQELDAVTDAVILYTVCPHLCSMWRTSLTAWSATWTILQRYFAGLCNCYYCGCNFCCCPPVA